MPQRKSPPPPSDNQNLGSNIQTMRKAAGISQNELAKRMRDLGRTNWWQNTVSRIEQGKQSVVTLADIMALQKILGTDVVDGTPMSSTMKNAAREIFVAKARTEITNINEKITELSEANDRLARILDTLAGDD